MADTDKVYGLLANMLRDAGYVVTAPQDQDKPFDDELFGAALQRALSDIDHLAFGETFEEAQQYLTNAAKQLHRWYQIRLK